MRRSASSSVSALLSVAALSLLTRATSASGSGSYPRLCGAACGNTFQTVSFSDEAAPPAKGGRFCGGGLLIESLFLCLRVHHCGGDDSPLLEDLRLTCLNPETGSGLFPAYRDVVDHWKDEEINGIRKFNATAGEGEVEVLAVVALPEDGFFQIWLRTLVNDALVGTLCSKADDSDRMISTTLAGITTNTGVYMQSWQSTR